MHTSICVNKYLIMPRFCKGIRIEFIEHISNVGQCVFHCVIIIQKNTFAKLDFPSDYTLLAIVLETFIKFSVVMKLFYYIFCLHIVIELKAQKLDVMIKFSIDHFKAKAIK